MGLRLKLLLWAIAPMLLALSATYYFVTTEYRQLSNENLQVLEKFLVESKKQELLNYTSLVLSSLDHIYSTAEKDNHVAQSLVAEIFDKISYNGEDGYFFVYDDRGNNIVHPKQPYRVGKNWWDLEDSKGNKTIQILIEKAKNGGGYYLYPWEKPSSNTNSKKISYSQYMGKWDWMIGTGIYLDDIEKQVTNIQKEINTHVDNTKQIILTVAISSILVIFLVGITYTLFEKKQTDIKIDALSQQIVNLQEEEQRRISRELHDGIIQILVSIKFSLESTTMQLFKNKCEQPDALNKASTNLDTAISEIRRISHDLHPRVLDELGLSAAIESLTKDFSQRTGIKTKFVKLAVKNLLPVEISKTLYRITQEALTNTEKHAQATRVTVSLSISSEWLELRISDNGQGIPSPQISPSNSGIGLRNLSERIEYQSGELEIDSSSSGTTIIAKLPKSFLRNQSTQTI